MTRRCQRAPTMPSTTVASCCARQREWTGVNYVTECGAQLINLACESMFGSASLWGNGCNMRHDMIVCARCARATERATKRGRATRSSGVLLQRAGKRQHAC